MSAIFARTAARASLRSAFQTAPRRNFSLMGSLRSFAKEMEGHPHARNPVSETPQAGDYAKYVKRIGTTFVM